MKTRQQYMHKSLCKLSECCGLFIFVNLSFANIFDIEPILHPQVVLYPLLIRIGEETVNPRPKSVTAALASPSLYIWVWWVWLVTDI